METGPKIDNASNTATRRKGGFTQGLPVTSDVTSATQNTASVCCGEPAILTTDGTDATGATTGGCCGEVVAGSAGESASTSGCCGEPAAPSGSGSGCCN